MHGLISVDRAGEGERGMGVDGHHSKTSRTFKGICGKGLRECFNRAVVRNP
jgi:hypothetical protein